MKKSNNQQLFLLTLFTGDGYEEKEINGFWLVKNWDGNTKEWRVSVYSPATIKTYHDFRKNEGKPEEKASQEDIIRKIIRGDN